MSKQLREAWTTIIRAEDYEAHMAAVGQAEANAQLVAEYFRMEPPPTDASILFLGAGTGQMFEFISPSILIPCQTTFADINDGYLKVLSERLRTTKGLRYTTVVDDVEDTRLRAVFDTVLAVLLLEHVDWRKAVSAIAHLATSRAFVIIQENPPTLATAMTPAREVAGTMQVFREVHPTLIPREELEAEFVRKGFVQRCLLEKAVADDKKMIAIGFERTS